MPVLQELVLVDIEKFSQYTFITHLNAEAISHRENQSNLIAIEPNVNDHYYNDGCDDQTISSHQCYGDVLNKVNRVKAKA